MIKKISFVVMSMFCLQVYAQDKHDAFSNFKGQKYLFEQGWYIIPSGTKAWSTFKESGIEHSGAAMGRAIENIKTSPHKMKSASEYIQNSKWIDDDYKKSANGSMEFMNKYANKLKKTGESGSSSLFKKSKSSLFLGYIKYSERTEDEQKRLKSFFQNYVTDYEKMTGSVNKSFVRIKKEYIDKLEVDWNKHFKKSNSEFEKHYQKSGERSNSLNGLWDVVVGWSKSIYHGFFKPTGKELSHLTQKSAFYVTKGVFGVLTFGTSTVYSTGLNFYHAGSMGVKLVSPTIESGLYASMGVLTYLASKGGEMSMKGTGAISKYSLLALGKVTRGGKILFDTTYDGTKAAIYNTVQIGAGTGEAIIETTHGALVLGYTALTQLPSQVLLGAVNSTVFLVYDGPKLILAKINSDDFQTVPAGTVLNKKELEKSGYEFEEIKMDEKSKRKVLEHIK